MPIALILFQAVGLGVLVGEAKLLSLRGRELGPALMLGSVIALALIAQLIFGAYAPISFLLYSAAAFVLVVLVALISRKPLSTVEGVVLTMGFAVAVSALA
jgi:hypothetical protein